MIRSYYISAEYKRRFKNADEKSYKRAMVLIMEDFNYTKTSKADNRRRPMDGGILGENNVYFKNNIYKENMSGKTTDSE